MAHVVSSMLTIVKSAKVIDGHRQPFSLITHRHFAVPLTLDHSGGAYTPIGHLRISLKTDTPNTSFGVSVFSEE